MQTHPSEAIRAVEKLRSATLSPAPVAALASPADAGPDSAFVQLLEMIPGGMWKQVGWDQEVRRNVARSMMVNGSFGVRRCHGDCYGNLTAIDQVAAVVQDGLLCPECAAFAARLAELKADACVRREAA